MTESQIQGKIIKDLEAKGWYVIKIIRANKNGLPDLFAFKINNLILIEVKKEGGIESPLQKFRKKEISTYGTRVITVYSFAEYESHNI